MTATNRSDEWLMGQVARGQHDCLEVLVRRYATPLLTYLSRMCGDAHRAEELMQETFLAVWTKRKTYKLDKPFKAWLYTIATNHCRTAFRGQKGKAMSPLNDTAELAPDAETPGPLESAVGAENAQIVTAAVAQLPEPQRMVVTLRVWGGMSYSEIAATAGKNEATVRSHMHRALESLRTSLTPVLLKD